MDYTEYDFQSRPQSAVNLKARPESAKSKSQLSQAYGSKKLPQVRPSSAAIPRPQRGVMEAKKKQTDDEIIFEEQDSEFLNYEKAGLDINAIFLNPPSSQQDNKRLPKNIKKDKEKLYEEQLELKQLLNKLKDENTRYKTKNIQLQKENNKLEKLLENLDTYIQTGQGHQPFSDHLLMNNLKKSLKEIKQQLMEKESELAILKKNIKLTKINEVETELKNYIEESIRLRSLLDQALRNQAAQKMATQMDNFEEKFYVQMKVINSLQQELEQVTGIIKLKDEELFNIQVRCEQFDLLKQRAEDQLQSYIQQVNEQNDKLELCQQEITNLKTINNNLIIKATKQHNDELRISDLEGMLSQFEFQIHQKQEQINQLEKLIQDMKHNEQETFKQFEKERKQLENDMEYYKNQFEIVNDKYKETLLVNAQQISPEKDEDDHLKSGRKSSRSPLRLGTMQVQPTFNKEQQIKREEQLLQQQREFQMQQQQQQQQQHQQQQKQTLQRPSSGFRRRRTVKMDDIKDLGLELNMRFSLKKLKLDDIIENDLFDSIIKQKGVISIKDIAVKLSDEPFELKDVEKMYLLARYMIEDNNVQNDWIEFDEECTAPLQIVRSIFKQLIGKCRIFNEEEEKQYKEEITIQIQKYKKSILSYLPTFNQAQLSRDQIVKAFNYIGIQISNSAYDYFFLRLFELQEQRDVRLFDYKLILDEWGKDEVLQKKRPVDRRETKRDLLNQQFVFGSRFAFEK